MREEHLYPEGLNLEDYDELEPEVTKSLVIVPSQIYVRQVVRHKYVVSEFTVLLFPFLLHAGFRFHCTLNFR